ncbi:membrane protein insertase YidC [Nakamurella sp.]|uniref:membrane protein insertase YidC n=1 Tax=Nakamurella sp. TaxID=1869182 RepID=UPI003783FBE2
MNFNFWSLDYIYYPISGIMWVWHKVFGAALGPDATLTWVLSVVFLIFTIRAILFKPFMTQMDAQLKMQAIQPEMRKLREKYKDDRQRLSEEMMKLNRAAGVNPLASCLPVLSRRRSSSACSTSCACFSRSMTGPAARACGSIGTASTSSTTPTSSPWAPRS